MNTRLYMAVTADKYELPCAVADTGAELAKLCKLDKHYLYICRMRDRPCKSLGMKFVTVEVEED